MNEWIDEEFKEYIDWCRAEYFLSELNEENDEASNKYDSEAKNGKYEY